MNSIRYEDPLLYTVIRGRRPTQSEACQAHAWVYQGPSWNGIPVVVMGYVSDQTPAHIGFGNWIVDPDGSQSVGDIWIPIDRNRKPMLIIGDGETISPCVGYPYRSGMMSADEFISVFGAHLTDEDIAHIRRMRPSDWLRALPDERWDTFLKQWPDVFDLYGAIMEWDRSAFFSKRLASRIGALDQVLSKAGGN